MDIHLIDLFLHLDKHLEAAVQWWGVWVYVILFLIIFAETGLIVMPLLPGDSLLFVAGAIAAVGGMSLPILLVSLMVAAIVGNTVNYSVGRWLGPKVFAWEHSRWFNREAFDRAHAFYEQYGPMTIVVTRFIPIIRTFAPFVAGVAQMTRKKFTLYDVSGALLWVVGVVSAGYFFGNIPWVKGNLEKIIWGLILVPGLIAMLGAWRAHRSAKSEEATPL